MDEDKTIKAYISKQTPVARQKLEQISSAIEQATPEATMAFTYGMPTYRINGKNMLHFAAFKNHIGLYATPDGHAEFEKELNKYKRGKGSVQFPIDEPLPVDLITRMARFRAEQLLNGGR